MRNIKIKFYDGEEKVLRNVTAIDFDGETGILKYLVDDCNKLFVEQRVKEVIF